MEVYDVIVLGGGSSGVIAAFSAAREGAKVLLIEKNGVLGGTNTTAMVCPLMTFHAGKQQIVAGLAQQVIDRLAARGGTLGHIPDPLGVTATITPIEPSDLKQVYFDMLADYPSLRLLLHTTLVDVVLKGEHIQNVRCVNKSGLHNYTAKTYIDATGDGDLAALAGTDYSQGRVKDGFSQPMSMLFKLGGVDFSAIRLYMQKHPEQFILRDGAFDQDYIAVSGFFDCVQRARAAGDLMIERDRVLMFQGVHPNEAIVNMARVIKKRGTKADELTSAEISVRIQIDEIVRFMRLYVPGCEHSYLAESGVSIGVRESRRIVGRYTLTSDDVLSCRQFEDSIACCAFPIDIHDPLGAGLDWKESDTSRFYDVPYRIMLPMKPDNLLTTGRCVSATHEAMASLRITATAMAMGEAAGIAAAIASKDDLFPADVNTSSLQQRIYELGGIAGRRFLKKTL
ncbi:MAG: FAD-dependent oxidoreductase [Acinetobacter sp.]